MHLKNGDPNDVIHENYFLEPISKLERELHINVTSRLPEYLVFRRGLRNNFFMYKDLSLTINNCKSLNCCLPYFCHLIHKNSSLPKGNIVYITI